MSSALDNQAVINRRQARNAGRMGAMAIAKKLGVKNKLVKNLVGKAGEMAGSYAAEKGRSKVRELVGYQKGGVIVLKAKAKGRRRKK
jgi:hypothetical protein